MAINLKEEINRTIELKNKVVTAKNNINKVIVRGGQTITNVRRNASKYRRYG